MTRNMGDVLLELKRIGCCSRCCLRFLGEKFSNFEEPEKSLKDLMPSLEVEDIKIQCSPCIACLGLLENTVLEQLFRLSCWHDIKDHETDVYKINFHLPPNIAIREKAIQLHIKQKFGDFFKEHNLEENTPHINVIFKQAFKSNIDKYCGKKYDSQSTYQLWVTVHHEDNEKEVKILELLDSFTYRKRKYLGDKIYSKNAVSNTLSTCDEKLFLKSFEVPPRIPVSPIRIDSEVKVETLPIFFCGRYCKYSRLLSQTPWNLETSSTDKEEENIIEAENESSINSFIHCVQDIIFDGIHEVFGFDKEKMTFTASGREDTDVRCLGSGRPFYVKIDCIKKNFPPEMFRKLEEIVNKSPDISIFDMQITDRNGTKEVKFGEEKKKKTYSVLCLIRDCSCTEEIVEKINQLGCKNLTIEQMTPIRVAHRRSLIARKKNIHFMKAVSIKGHQSLIHLTMQTQAGTYVKEFIHGDFGRTSPCLASLVEADVDIFRLDVIGIDLDWPKHINSVPHPALMMVINSINPISKNHEAIRESVLINDKKEGMLHLEENGSEKSIPVNS
ncbi:tRNA pseudouridine synthase Pus10 isoform X2 [Coccinella septempunctata]|nr:tRNA pseudouridine synthase Pus10 isoform X2 [Coccinella septempunctata]